MAEEDNTASSSALATMSAVRGASPEELELRARNMRLTAEMNEGYYRVRAATAARFDRLVQVLSAVSGLSAVAVWFTAPGASAESAKVWAVLLMLSATLSAASPIIRWFDDAVKFTNLASKWTDVAGRLRIMDVETLDEAAWKKRLVEIATTMEALEREDTSRTHDKLLRKLQKQIIVRHGLSAAP